MTVALDAMRGWAAQRLGYNANTMGIRQAAPMAQALRTTVDVEELADSIAEMSMKDALYWWEFLFGANYIVRGVRRIE